jgi:hypothetical protein
LRGVRRRPGLLALPVLLACAALAAAPAGARAGEAAAAPPYPRPPVTVSGGDASAAPGPGTAAEPPLPPPPDLETAFPPAARPGPVPGTGEVEPTEATMDLPEAIMRGLGLHVEKTPEQQAEEARRRFHWNAVPFILTNPLIEFGFGVAGAGVFTIGEDGTKLSKFATNVLYTVLNQISVPLRTSIYFSGGDWSLVGYTNWQIFPAPTWGLGGNTPDANEVIVDKSLVRVWETAFRRVFSDLYVGAGGYFDRFYAVSDRGTAPGVANPFTSYPYGTTGPYNNVGLSVDLLWESRDNPVNATHGYYATATYRAFPRWLGSSYDWQSLYVDGRAYFGLPRPNVLALWAYGWFSFGNTPYLNLPSIGSDPDARSGRGYIEGRHVGKSVLYAEAEYRFQIWDFVGGVVGVNVHSASQAQVPGEPKNAPRFQYWYPAATVGLRVLVNKPTRTNGLIEYGVGLDGSHGIYLNINENF